MIAMTYAAYFSAMALCPPWQPEDGNWKYVRRVLISVNQFVNTVLGGQPDETLSSRAGRLRNKHKAARLTCAVLDKLDPCHCEGSIELDADGRPQPHQLYLREKDK